MEQTELKQRIQLTMDNQKADEQNLYNLKQQRAKLYIANANNPKIREFDKNIASLIARIDNSPAVIKELESQLDTENARLAQAERDNLLEQQKVIAREVEKLSKEFVELLKKAVDFNEILKVATTAEANLASKTGQHILGDYCDPSAGSLPMLLEKSQAQLAGQNANVLRQASKNIQIRL